MQLVGIASGGQPYESSHNCFNGLNLDNAPLNMCEDEVMIEDYDS